MRDPNEMLNDWKPETASLLATLRGHGFTIYGGNNGEGETFKVSAFATEDAFLEELLACDEANLYVYRKATKESSKTPGKMIPRLYSLFIVMGNSPGELVADYGIPSDTEDSAALDKATSEHGDKWEDRKQPKIRAADKYPTHYAKA